ncbi:hypothetical protein ACGGAQ_05540 [Micromonospora sp. NPDC047557]|uniref:hypothetical protein n=1 Tax=Micromonospora sp. NPDC047557 TaxID=3364250 RepID=UPI003719FC8A
MALAIVVEARSIMSKWVPGEQTVIKSIQGATWAAPLVLYAIAIPQCFQALAGSQVSAGWTELIPFAISLGVASLVLNPALELLIRSNARAAAYILRFLSKPRSIFKIFKLRLSAWRLKRTLHKLHREVNWSEINLRSLRWKLDEAGAALLPEGRKIHADLSNQIERIAARRIHLTQIEMDLKSRRSEIKKEYQEIREEHLQRLEAALTGTERERAHSSQKVSQEHTAISPDAAVHPAIPSAIDPPSGERAAARPATSSGH